MIAISDRSTLEGESLDWHKVACAAYGADLPALDRLCNGAGSILDLGCGNGRVALQLARSGASITAIDLSSELLEDLDRLASQGSARVRTVCADVRRLPEADLAPHDAVLAPMQLLQILGGAEARAQLLAAVPPLLTPGGIFAASLIEPHHLPEALRQGPSGRIAPDPEERPLPDCHEEDGWVYTAAPVAIERRDGSVWVESLRQVASPDGHLSQTTHLQEIEVLDADTLSREAADQGLRELERLAIGETRAHSGSTIVVYEAETAATG